MAESHLPKPWIRTPCVESSALSKLAGCRVFLKLENLQPSGSFKSRGIGNLILHTLNDTASIEPSHPDHSDVLHKPDTTTITITPTDQAKAAAQVDADRPSSPDQPLSASNDNTISRPHPQPKKAKYHFYCSSGGNAGLACVTASTTLGYPSTVVVPLVIKKGMMDKLKVAGANEVIQVGETWFETDRYLRDVILPTRNGSVATEEDGVGSREMGFSGAQRVDEAGRGDTNGNGAAEGNGEIGIYVPPFEHPLIWQGHSTIIEEVQSDLGSVDGIICSVGGGGLFNGLMLGLDKTGMKDTKVIAVETKGADSLSAALKAGELVTLPGITSIATSLGCTRVSPTTFEYAYQNSKVESMVVSDKSAVSACMAFLNGERILVEPACGAALAPIYDGRLREVMPDLKMKDKVVVIVCGGVGAGFAELRAWGESFGLI